METRDVLMIIGILIANGGSYGAIMTRMRLKLQHIDDIKIAKEDVDRKLAEERTRLDNSHNAIYAKINIDHTEVMKSLSLLQISVTEIKTKVEMLPCPGRFAISPKTDQTCG